MPDPRNRLQWNATCKVYPAIVDLMAMECVVQFYDDYTFVAGGNITRYSGVVPEDKLWICSYICSVTSDAAADLIHNIDDDDTTMARLQRKSTGGAYDALISSGMIILDEGQRIAFGYYFIGAGSTCRSSIAGYQVSKY